MLVGCFLCASLTPLVAPVQADEKAVRDGNQTWRTVKGYTDWENQRVDTRTGPGSESKLASAPAEEWPFDAPFTAEEIGYRLMDFTHMAPWSHVIADAFGIITKSGYLTQGVTVGMAQQTLGPGAEGQIKAEPGTVYSKQIFYYTYPPKNDGLQQMWLMRRTGAEHAEKIDYFVYSPSLRRVRRQPPPRREAQFPDSVQSFDDIAGLEAWEFDWRMLGADTLYETVRFPNTRDKITLAKGTGGFYDEKTAEIKIMGERYPFYRPDGGVDCFVVVAEPDRERLPDYKISKLIYWVDQYYFYPLRIEQYDESGALKTVQVRFARHENRSLPEGRGYASIITVYYDVNEDLISYSLHDAHLIYEWSEEEKALFTPDFMRRRWLKYPQQSQSLVDEPEQFYLRPHLLEGYFPEERTIKITADVAARIAAQESQGRLIFAE